jgi:hypothetical protein
MGDSSTGTGPTRNGGLRDDGHRATGTGPRGTGPQPEWMRIGLDSGIDTALNPFTGAIRPDGKSLAHTFAMTRLLRYPHAEITADDIRGDLDDFYRHPFGPQAAGPAKSRLRRPNLADAWQRRRALRRPRGW